MITCKTFIGYLTDYVEGALPEDERCAFDAHMEVCPDCVAFLDSYRDSGRLAALAFDGDGEIPDSVPEGLVEAVLAAVGSR